MKTNYIVTTKKCRKEDTDMLQQLFEFREKLDEIIIGDIHRRITLCGYDNFTGRFIKWYAQYYHNKKVDYLIQMSHQRGVSHEQEVYTEEVFTYGYQDIENTVIWMCLPLKDCANVVGDREYRDFYSVIYGDDYIAEANGEEVYKTKSGRRDIQFLDYLEWKYKCDFLEVVRTNISSYSCTTAKELFPVLDAVHLHPQQHDAVFDFGCGKGGALIGALDYGFNHIGGIELDRNLYNICIQNFEKLNINKSNYEVFCGDFINMEKELDNYTWFLALGALLNHSVIDNLCDSYRRKKRKMIMISLNPHCHEYFENTGIFRLRTQLSIDTLKRVCDVFETV